MADVDIGPKAAKPPNAVAAFNLQKTIKEIQCIEKYGTTQMKYEIFGVAQKAQPQYRGRQRTRWQKRKNDAS